MEEIVTVNGQQYILNTPTTLTQAQRNEVIRQLSTQTVGCSSCGDNNISTLATGCPTTVIPAKTTKTFNCTASGGTGAYTYTLTIGTAIYTSATGIGGSWSQSHTFDTVGTITPVSLKVVDTCTGTTLSCTDSCPSGIIVQDPEIASVTLSGCTSSIQIGATCTLSATCKDQFGASILCQAPTWFSTEPLIATVLNGVVTGKSAGTTRISATSGGIPSNSVTVTVTAIPCTLPTCSFTIS